MYLPLALLALQIAASPIRHPKRNDIFSISLQKVATSPASKAFRIGRAGAAHKTLSNIHKRQYSENATNEIVDYVANVTVGGQIFSLLLDTGSSNTFVGVGRPRYQSTTAANTGAVVQVTYGSGEVAGQLVNDTVTLASGLTIQNQGVTNAEYSSGFQGVNGILGLGPTALTQGTVYVQSNFGRYISTDATVTTVMDSAKAQGLISQNILGVYFAPSNGNDTDVNGIITYGGVDTSLNTSEIIYTPITSVSPASNYWGITAQLSYGSTVLSSAITGIVDTGTTLIYLADDIFEHYMNSIEGAEIDTYTGLLRFPKANSAALSNVTFVMQDTTTPIVLTPSAQLVPDNEYDSQGLDSSYSYSWISYTGDDSGSGLDIIFGMKALERVLTVFDSENSQIGFATTAYSYT